MMLKWLDLDPFRKINSDHRGDIGNREMIAGDVFAGF